MSWRNFLPALKEEMRTILSSAEVLVPPTIKNFDPFLMWLNDILDKLISTEPDKGAKQHFASARRVFFGIAGMDEYYRRATVYLIYLIRSAPDFPMQKFELEWIEKKYGVKIPWGVKP